MKLINIIADNTTSFSISAKMRQARHLFFLSLVSELPKPIRILDIGGTENYWKHVGGILGNNDFIVTLLNLQKEKVTASNFDSVIGNATNLSDIADNEYDVVFSNSVIEHINTFDQQEMMVKEILRVGKKIFFIQTPNKYFPIEPHFVLPLFQFLPRNLKINLLCARDLGWVKRCSNKLDAAQVIDSIKLLSYEDLRKLFPEANIYREKFFGLTKSYVAYGGMKFAAKIHHKNSKRIEGHNAKN